MQSGNWIIRQKTYEPDRESFYESIFSLGNGYMGVRGFAEDRQSRNSYEFYTFIAGIFDYIKPGITDMVCTPNFLHTRLVINGELFEYKTRNIVEFERSLDLKEGTLTKTVVWQDSKGCKTKIESARFFSIDSLHNAALRYKITPLNYSGHVTFETGIDAQITNNPVSDDQLKNDVNLVEFLRETEKGTTADGICYMRVSTKGTEYGIGEAFALSLAENGENIELHDVICEKERFISKIIEFDAQQGKEYVLDKMVAVYTSRDSSAITSRDSSAITSRDSSAIEIKDAAINSAVEAKKIGFEGMLDASRKAWKEKWNVADIQIEGDEKAQLSIRYNIFQLMQGNAENDPKVSIGARAIFHGRYKGCYFWDTEIFMFPFFAYTNPKAARNLLMYRYHTLPGAEENARRQSVEGARYAWMCTIDGMEQCDTWDTGCCEIHITADIAYAINQYCEITGDEEFLKEYGAEILIKTARFWNSRFTYDKRKDHYNMLFVKGPNEYGGVTENNTYTTWMALNNFKLAMDAIALLKNKYGEVWNNLKEKTGFSESEQDKWRDISAKAVINYDAQKKLYIEDDNFLKLEPLNIEEFKTDDTPLYHKISFDRLQRYMVLKQADVILLMVLLPESFTDEEKRAAWDIYEPITLHDSTLSFGTHALFAARLGLMDKAYEYFNKSLRLDLDDIMHNTSREGVHFASFGATWQAVVNGFGGVELDNGRININPHLPEKWTLLKFKIFHKGKLMNVSITKDGVNFYSDRQDLNFNPDMAAQVLEASAG